jgi:hypothetical protein
VPVVDLLREEVGIVVEGELNAGGSTRSVPESPQKPFLLKSFRRGRRRKVESRAALVRA